MSFKSEISNIKQIYLIASGKGGVGKSTVTVLLAKQLSAQGAKVGIVDADIYGPSIPTILGVEDNIIKTEDNNFIPLEADSIKLISIGFLVKPEASLAWRGPMIAKAVNQFLFGTKWGDLDYLLIDMPPGTGDVNISIIQKVKVDGAFLVTIPDKLSIIDVERAIDLFNKMKVDIFGLIENMGYLEVGETKISLYSNNEAENLARKHNLKLLAKLPMIPNLSGNKELYNSDKLKIRLV